MVIRLTGTDTNGVLVDAPGDWWITREGELVANNGIAFLFQNHFNVTYSVQGAVMSGGGQGISSGSSINNAVLIGPTGVVQSSSYGVRLIGDSHEIRNEGSVTALNSNAGLSITGYGAMLTNSGDTYGRSSGMQVIGNDAELHNFGTTSGGGAGIYLSGLNGEIDNHGSVYGESSGLLVSGGRNSVVNTGEITGDLAGLRSIDGNGEIVTVINTGLIQSERGSEAITSTTADLKIENEGTIRGDIAFGTGDDRYLALAGQLIGEVHADKGDDRVTLGDGALGTAFVFDGGAGVDTLDLSAFSHGIWADLTYAGAEVWTRDNTDWQDASGAWREIVDVAGVENIIGTAGIDLMRGDDGDNSFGYVGSRFIAGIETIGGRGGTDTVDFSHADSAVWVDLGFAGTEAWTQDDDDATDALGAFREIADLADIENLTGSERVDVLFGDAGDNVFGYRGSATYAGIEEINGRGGSDTADFSGFEHAVWVDLLYVGSDVWTQDDYNATDAVGTFREIADLGGIENITGTDWTDLIAADSGANVIDGGWGHDDIYGRGGADTFVYRDDFGRDTLFDFSADDAEKIDLSDVTEIINFADLVTNHVVDDGGTAVIEVDAGNRITLDGWTVADIGAGDPIDADDFIF